MMRLTLLAYNAFYKFDWNGPTFIVSALIGVLALSIAFATTFQSLLFAGSGRLKTNWRAIGPWSQYTHTSFSWTEFRFRTTTSVPYIDVPGYLMFRYEKVLPDVKSGKKIAHCSAASWSNLIFSLSEAPHST